jgi:MarR family 2-MHQ and catechol resistance regulon transcriptional repressor
MPIITSLLILTITGAIIGIKRIPKIKENLNMDTDSELVNENFRVARMIYQTYTRFENCLDGIFRVHGLTMERFLVLLAIKNHDTPARIVDIARWGERRPNSVSTIVDRMVKAGLLKRVRDKTDRRTVHVFITSKGEDALKPANLAALEFFQQIMSPLSLDDGRTFASLFKMINYKLLEYLNPGSDIEGILKNDSETHDRLVKLVKQML